MILNSIVVGVMVVYSVDCAWLCVVVSIVAWWNRCRHILVIGRS